MSVTFFLNQGFRGNQPPFVLFLERDALSSLIQNKGMYTNLKFRTLLLLGQILSLQLFLSYLFFNLPFMLITVLILYWITGYTLGRHSRYSILKVCGGLILPLLLTISAFVFYNSATAAELYIMIPVASVVLYIGITSNPNRQEPDQALRQEEV